MKNINTFPESEQNNPFTKKGPVVSNRTFPKMAKSNSYLTLPLYNTQNTYRCVEQEIPI